MTQVVSKNHAKYDKIYLHSDRISNRWWWQVGILCTSDQSQLLEKDKRVASLSMRNKRKTPLDESSSMRIWHVLICIGFFNIIHSQFYYIYIFNSNNQSCLKLQSLSQHFLLKRTKLYSIEKYYIPI